MYRNLVWKFVAIAAVIALAVAAFVLRGLRLGLDLKGGIHLVLQVQTDDAVRLEVDTVAEQFRTALKDANLPVTSVKVTSLTSFAVEGVPPSQESQFRTLVDQQI